MKLIFAVDAIFQPLTGIGRYAWELARGMHQHHAIDSVKYFSHGRWVTNPTQQATQAQLGDTHGHCSQSPSAAARLRVRLSRSRMLVDLYARLTPPIYRWRLRGFKDHLYHSPNYLLPPFDGRSVATVHDLSTLLCPQFHPAARVAFMDKVLPQTFKRAHHIITDADAVKSEIIQHFGWPADRITAIPLGVSPAYRPMDAQHTLPVLQRYGLEHGGYVLCVATLEPRKNIERLIAAFSSLPPALRQHYPLVLAGAQGWGSETLHALIQQSGIRYLSYLPEHALPALYAGARLFAFPSIYEGFGLPVLEAMASGVPVLTSNCSTLPEVSAGAGLLVDPLDTVAIRDGLVRGLEDDPWRAMAIECGRIRAGQLTWDSCVARTLDLYSSLATRA